METNKALLSFLIELTTKIFDEYQIEYIKLLGHKNSYKLGDIINYKHANKTLPHCELKNVVIFEHENFKCSISEDMAFYMLYSVSKLEKLPKDFEYKTNIEALPSIDSVKKYIDIKHLNSNLQCAFVSDGYIVGTDSHALKAVQTDYAGESMYIHPLRGKIEQERYVNFERVLNDIKDLIPFNLPTEAKKAIKANKKLDVIITIALDSIILDFGKLAGDNFDSEFIKEYSVLNTCTGFIGFECKRLDLLLSEKGTVNLTKCGKLFVIGADFKAILMRKGNYCVNMPVAEEKNDIIEAVFAPECVEFVDTPPTQQSKPVVKQKESIKISRFKRMKFKRSINYHSELERLKIEHLNKRKQPFVYSFGWSAGMECLDVGLSNALPYSKKGLQIKQHSPSAGRFKPKLGMPRPEKNFFDILDPPVREKFLQNSG